MTITIEINPDKAIKYLVEKAKKINSDLTPALAKAAIYMQGEVKSSIAGQRAEMTSVDTGRFLNSINYQAIQTLARVWTDIEYAKFLEYGTSKMNARHHFFNSVARNQAKVTEILKENIKV